MKYDFDTVVDRHGTMSLKYDFAKERGHAEDELPLWVADMDFKTAPAITEALLEAATHGIYGYSEGKETYFDAVAAWFGNRFGWEVKRQWLIKTPGVVFALAMAIKAYTDEGDGVLIQQPVYYPFSEVIRDNNRTLVNSPLVLKDGHYVMDLEDMEKKIVEQKVKLYILCNPHNPGGRVWTEQELRDAAAVCQKHNVLIVSDEIHCDFVYKGYKHTVLASLDPAIAEITVTCTSPSKTFNLAGLQISNIFISNQKLRRRFRQQMNGAGFSQCNLFGLVGCQAAYETGGEWLAELMEVLESNLEFTRTYVKEHIPRIHMLEPEGTYLVWLDFRDLGMTEAEREELMTKKAKLWVDSGAMFGSEGEGFERINIACPRETLQKALEQLKNAIDSL